MKILSKFFAPDFPFSPRKLPFFYGGIIFICSIFARIVSIPAHTVSLCAFTEPLIENFHISRTEWSNILLLSTLLSSLFLPWFGATFDRIGSRKSTTFSTLFLGLSILFLGNMDHLIQPLGLLLPSNIATLIILFVGLLFLKLFGQNLVPLASRVLIVQWYDAKSCTMIGLAGIFISAAFGSAPKITELLIRQHGFLGTWILIASITLLFLVPVIWVLCRDNPEQIGLSLDGKNQTNSARPSNLSGKTLSEALTTFDFWIFTICACNTIFLTTGLQIHIVDIFRDAHAPTHFAMSIFFPIAIVSSIFGLIFSFIQDKISIKNCLLVAFSVHFLMLMTLEKIANPWGLGLFAFLLGCNWGLYGIIFSAPWPKLFGRKHLNHIMSTVSFITVIASSIAPSAMSYTKKYAGSYFFATRAISAISVILLCVSIIYIFKTKKQKL